MNNNPKRDIARELFKFFKMHSRRSPNTFTPRESGANNEPQLLSSVINEIVTERNWKQGIAEGNLFSEWEKIVGGEIAEHAAPITLLDGKLTIQTTSSAWATQLRLISTELLKTINTSAPGALVEELSILGPHAPSWKRGLRTIRGAKGPRDTYG